MKKRNLQFRNYRTSRVFQSKKARKKNNKIIPYIKKIFVVLLFIISIYLLFTNDYLKIKTININDSAFKERVSALIKNELNQKKLFLLNKDNYLLVNKDRLKNIIQSEVEEIKSITIIKKFPSKLEVEISERKPKIIWETENKKYLLDEEGYIIKEAFDVQGLKTIKDTNNLPINKNDRLVFSKFIGFIDFTSKFLEEKLGIKTDTIEVRESTFVIHLLTDKGYTLILDSTKNAEGQYKKLEETLKQLGEQSNNLEYIDLTVKNKAIYKFK